MMIDLHCHILPGVDDGAADLETACDMAAAALENGTGVIVATPHCNSPRGGDNFRSARVDALFDRLRARLDDYGLPVRVLNGAEVQLHGDMAPLLRRDRVYTLAGSRYLLSEFPFDMPADEMTRQLDGVFRAGFVPVVAHPERYDAVQETPGIVERWIQKGAVLQINQTSLAGIMGRTVFQTADGLVRGGLAGVIASDAHGLGRRAPVLGPLRDAMEGQFDAEYLKLLFEENPRRIIQNLEILHG